MFSANLQHTPLFGTLWPPSTFLGEFRFAMSRTELVEGSSLYRDGLCLGYTSCSLFGSQNRCGNQTGVSNGCLVSTASTGCLTTVGHRRASCLVSLISISLLIRTCPPTHCQHRNSLCVQTALNSKRATCSRLDDSKGHLAYQFPRPTDRQNRRKAAHSIIPSRNNIPNAPNNGLSAPRLTGPYWGYLLWRGVARFIRRGDLVTAGSQDPVPRFAVGTNIWHKSSFRLLGRP